MAVRTPTSVTPSRQRHPYSHEAFYEAQRSARERTARLPYEQKLVMMDQMLREEAAARTTPTGGSVRPGTRAASLS